MLFALGVMAFVLSTWTWALFGRDAEPRASVLLPADVPIQAAFRIFGVASTSTSADVASTGLAVRLLGVVASETGERGYALLQFDGKESFAARAGQVVADGVTLVEIGDDHVVIERGGQRERLDWPKAAAPAPVVPTL